MFSIRYIHSVIIPCVSMFDDDGEVIRGREREREREKKERCLEFFVNLFSIDVLIVR